MSFHEPYNCISEFDDQKAVISNRLLDTHALGVVLFEILVGTDVVLGCPLATLIVSMVTASEEYIDKDTAKLLHDLIDECDDRGLEDYLNKTLKEKPEVISENVRALDYAVRENREFITKQGIFQKQLAREPATLKEKYGVSAEDIVRVMPEFKKVPKF